ncbi:AMP-binding protein [Dactylosporangium matsuzakiense]|uniref:Fatty-acyl-CoA synthase n=1 Tax=Dactylosporangium matsuzakiense TaxID=53360 RepID=A0A9W6NRK6_9ACTN|nr:AMP-binding protein [Dactylosporangium matsuzakiense]UWZ48544.1 AMP-binding protein [Dactylosporangium matsuzakiense]GLL06371.1 fatty-acyl-CoA synthase [Dactylosporangium matsuzakiense]
MMLGQTLLEKLEHHQDAVFVDGRGAALPFPELAKRCAEHAGELRALIGDRPRPRLLLAKENGTGLVVALLAALAAGAVPIVVDPTISDDQLAILLADCGVRAVLADRHPARLGDRTAQTAEGAWIVRDGPDTAVSAPAPDTALCRLSSGSTKTPACVEFSATAVLNAATTWAAASGLSERDRILCFAGLYNGLAFNTSLIPAMVSGASLIVSAAPPTGGHVIRMIDEHRPTVIVGFPVLYERIAHRIDSAGPQQVRAVQQARLRLSSAAPLAAETRHRLARHDIEVHDYYGTIETGPVTFNHPAADGQGRLLPNAVIALADDRGDGTYAALNIKTTSGATKFLNYPGLFESQLDADGFFCSGDLGFLEGDRLFLRGRVSGHLNIGGKKLSRELLRECVESVVPPGATVFAGCVSDRDGRDAIGVLVETGGPLDPALIRSRVRERLGASYTPAFVAAVAALPRSGTGKVRRVDTEKFMNELFAKGSDR